MLCLSRSQKRKPQQVNDSFYSSQKLILLTLFQIERWSQRISGYLSVRYANLWTKKHYKNFILLLAALLTTKRTFLVFLKLLFFGTFLLWLKDKQQFNGTKMFQDIWEFISLLLSFWLRCLFSLTFLFL